MIKRLLKNCKKITAFTFAKVAEPQQHRFKQAAFTLAEVLITLGIIGIVAAMTIPTLTKAYEKKITITQLKKIYSTFNQAFLTSASENGAPSGWVNESEVLTEEKMKEYFNTFWAPYLKIRNYCNDAASCGYNGQPKAFNKNDAISLNFFGSSRISAFLQDGKYIMLRSVNYGESNLYFSKTQQLFVDINGPTKPNVFGKDIFIFVIDLNNQFIRPYGYNFSDSNINYYCFGNGRLAVENNTCAEKIVRDHWQINYW